MTYDKLIQNIDKLSSKKGVNRTTALTQSGVGKNFIYNINKGSAPSSEKIQQLADYFNISTDYLLGNTDNLQSVKSDVDPQTAEAIKLFANMPQDKRALALKILKVFLDEE